MALKIALYDPRNVHSGPVKAGLEAVMLEGSCVGLDSNGDLVLADFRNTTYNRPACRGFLTSSCQSHDPMGNVLQTSRRLSYTRVGRVSGYTGLVPGTTYKLSSGGAIQPTTPGSSNDLDQEVGYAESDTLLIISIGPANIQ